MLCKNEYKQSFNIIVIVLIVLFFPVIIIIATSCGFTHFGMSMRGVCTGSKVVHAMVADEPQVVMHSLQVIYHHPFNLPFHATPEAEGQATSSSQALGGIDPFRPMIFGDSVGMTTLKK